MVEVFTEDRAIEGSNHPAEEQEVVLKSRFISLLPPMVTGQIALLSLTGRSKVIDESGDEIAVTREELKNKVKQIQQPEGYTLPLFQTDIVRSAQRPTFRRNRRR
ncbi:hypothetical protein A3C59_03175 [Candidatus Daviesbacteria bacterium RIFCSPHIGHO2_02_FULL_36_13]|uniref:Uncharacterized protein n=1 Tax=Candidatus Daviesbacteria bacterium RIFCSPHIGHO2_02_FULL_36_13 TaxID=1797768 RepID=A0A1F5JPS7_9BACT|nr:MAG: hypothetical protein A3C59_03175 [Candidatus Daviesbacteria bacterium RIFCSPHIGHO2_02_FULL_36_13]OGE44669.1 MAG: hypothetical protein A3A45_02345 [Candidatus Daviesbacteria bacterium RIFCSPLOWO2_01_FULL_36_8]